ncbi:amidohydrolase [Marinicrinis lubricantis]|uniref:Amidohydrolase n=1 Tax=Marinicrinis lubricantis TaxID=2086470 RepID=A0ABW1IMT7_9BACL
MEMEEKIRMELGKLHPQMIKWRRQLHQHPELSFKEEMTTSMIVQNLNSWGIENRLGLNDQGVIGTIYGGKPGPTVALRADIDALPIQDQKTCEYHSKVSGVMHACGHDGHTAILLSLAKVLQQEREQLHGNVRLIFQHAEEVTPGGALSMIRSGAVDDAAVIYGLHLWSPLEAGTAASAPAHFMAAADEFSIEIVGKGGHAGLPHETVDSVMIGSQLVVQLQTIVSRSINPAEPAVVSVGSFHGGTGFNIIADRAKLEGTVRTFNTHTRDQIEQRMHALCTHIGEMFGASVTLKYNRGYPPVVNHSAEYERFLKVSEPIFQPHSPLLLSHVMAGEDFSYYLEKIPGCFVFVGAGNTKEGIISPHHHPLFDIDERSLLLGAELLLQLVLDYQRSNPAIIS